MSKYFFDLYNDRVTIDEDGAEFVDLEAARNSAVTDIRSLAADSVREFGHLVRSHRLVIRDGGREIAAITFGDVIEIRD